MSIDNEFMCTTVRFKFWNSKTVYTVEYTPGLRMWFVFADETNENCLFKITLREKERVKCDFEKAQDVLNRYFESIKTEDYASLYGFY